MTNGEPIRFTADELAVAAGSIVERVHATVAASLLSPGEDGLFAAGDVHRMRIIDAFVINGIPLDVLVRARDEDVLNLAYYDQLHSEPGPTSELTYGEFKRSVGDRSELLGRLITALGLAEPKPDSRLSQSDETLLLRLLTIIADTGVPDLGLRVARLLGDSTRRAAQAVLGVYGEAVEQTIGSISGIPSRENYRDFLEPWSRYAQIAPELGRWLTARHMTSAIDDFSLTATEEFLANSGFVPPRDREPPAIAFVDLVGYTQLAQERGDELAAKTALEFGQLAERVASVHGGSVVKLLGDGVLLRFSSAVDGVSGSLALLAELESSELPSGHAGLASGPVIERDGDVFGATVNLASRIASAASAGQLLVDTAVATRLGDGLPRAVPIGAPELKGIAAPVELFRVER